MSATVQLSPPRKAHRSSEQHRVVEVVTYSTAIPKPDASEHEDEYKCASAGNTSVAAMVIVSDRV